MATNQTLTLNNGREYTFSFEGDFGSLTKGQLETLRRALHRYEFDGLDCLARLDTSHGCFLTFDSTGLSKTLYLHLGPRGGTLRREFA